MDPMSAIGKFLDIEIVAGNKQAARDQFMKLASNALHFYKVLSA
jgi:hypothetical protein